MLVKDVNLKLYLEGIQVSFLDISINEGGNSTFPSASIALPASAEAFRLLPRTQVHVFYKIKEKYFLIFEGELQSVGFNQNSYTRTVGLSCVGVMNYFANSLKAMGGQMSEVDMSNDTTLFFNYKKRSDLEPETTSKSKTVNLEEDSTD